MSRNFDQLLLLDDFSQCGATLSAKARQRELLRLVHTLRTGQVAGYTDEPARYAFVLAGNENLNSAAQDSSANSPLTQIPEVMIAEDDEHGVFSCIPDDFESASEFANSLLAAAQNNHGHAVRLLVGHLLEKPPEDVTKSIEKSVSKFRGKAKVDENDGAAVRTADMFGLIFAAGCLGKRAGCFPKTWKVGPAVLSCYRDYQRLIAPPPPPFHERLHSLLKSDALTEVPPNGLKKSKKAEKRARKASGFFKTKENKVEVWVRQKRIESILPGWSIDRRRPEVSKLLIADECHRTTKRKVFAGGAVERFFVFRMPFASEDQAA